MLWWVMISCSKLIPLDGGAPGIQRSEDPDRLPDGSGAQPWGGADPDGWEPEAVLANAASGMLNELSDDPSVLEAIVAVPVQLWTSDLYPFGDGQSNAAISFSFWGEPRPPVVAALAIGDRGATVRLILDRDLPMGDVVRIELLGGPALEAVGQRDDQGDLRATIALPEGIDWTGPHGEARALVRPQGWNGAFPLHFYHPSTSASALAASVPPWLADFGAGRTVPDPERIALSGASAYRALTEHAFGPGYNTVPYVAPHAHGSHPSAGSTAVGQISSWVAAPPSVPWKHVYACLQARDPWHEAQEGVPTGTGWHRIGDPAESLVHTLGQTGFLAGWASAAPLAGSGFGSAEIAYGLSDVATFRQVRPGEALVTSESGGTPLSGRPTFHWYANHLAEPLCAEIWTHPCPPSDDLGFGCG